MSGYILLSPDEMLLAQDIITLIDKFVELKNITLEQYLYNLNILVEDKSMFERRDGFYVNDAYGRRLFKCIERYCNDNGISLTDYYDNLKMMVEYEKKSSSD